MRTSSLFSHRVCGPRARGALTAIALLLGGTSVHADTTPAADKAAEEKKAEEKKAEEKKAEAPAAGGVVLDAGRLVLPGQIGFTADSDAIQPESEPALAALVEMLKAHPEIEQVAIEGYVDAGASPEASLKRSQQRAESVVRWLVAHGVTAGRLVARGFGAANPIADNDSEAARVKNRRIEARVVAPSLWSSTPAKDGAKPGRRHHSRTAKSQ